MQSPGQRRWKDVGRAMIVSDRPVDGGVRVIVCPASIGHLPIRAGETGDVVGSFRPEISG